MEISADDVPYEEEVLRERFKVGTWLRYLSARGAAPQATRVAMYERALRALPGSYKLWHAYLTELAAAARALPITDPAHAALNAAFERALAAGMSRMPRVWHMYASALLDQRLLTRARRAIDRALRALPPTQHHHVWTLALRLAGLPGCPAETAVRVLRRCYLQFDPAHAEELVAFLVTASRFREAAEQLAAAIDDDGFRSAKGTTKRQLLLDLCEILTKHPDDDVAGMPVAVEAILCNAARKFPEEAGALWTALASHYTRKGIYNKARDVFEAGAAAAATVKDFGLVFESYLHFEHAVVAAELDDAIQEEKSGSVIRGCWLADKDDADLNMARLERLLERRPEMLNSVRLRQNPHDVQAWHERVKIFKNDPGRQAAAYAEAVRTVDPMKATGKPHTLWLAFAKMYEGRGMLASAREVFRRATQVSFKSADDLADVWCERAEMELRHQNHEAAIELLRARRAGPDQAAQRIHDLGLATPLLVLSHAALLRQHSRFEDAFRVYERGVRSFKHPHAEPIWAAYLAAFVERYGKTKPERVRDLFEDAVRHAPPEAKKAVFLSSKLAVYDAYVARAAALFSVAKTREVYHRAIAGGGLTDDNARVMCVRFADLETGLGEIHRARALYVYASGFSDPGAHPDFWRRWNEFEVVYGDESTFRDMLRLKRTMATAACTGVQAAETGAVKRPCAGQQVEGCGTLQSECKRVRVGVAL
ncbi:unnamed protein product [Urochloa decumbens]|uniref:Pre-mRNA-splicing factor SYF1 n=1 Tax=Urochloa decumbens TaxID=240449 RepID=A0ABC9DT66_9POAL